MRKSAARLFVVSVSVAMVGAVVALCLPATSDAQAGGMVSCGPCSEPFENEYGQLCWKISCSNKPNKCGPEIMCTDFGGGGGGGGEES